MRRQQSCCGLLDRGLGSERKVRMAGIVEGQAGIHVGAWEEEVVRKKVVDSAVDVAAAVVSELVDEVATEVELEVVSEIEMGLVVGSDSEIGINSSGIERARQWAW